jgi:predicted nucleic acid-binding protein
MVCLDTSILIDIMREDKDTKELEEYLDGQSLCIASPTAFELWCGALLSSEKERTKVRGLIESFDVLEMDRECALEAAKIYAELVKRGRELPPLDAMIAGVAKRKGERLITRDEHFRWIDGLNVEIWK